MLYGAIRHGGKAAAGPRAKLSSITEIEVKGGGGVSLSPDRTRLGDVFMLQVRRSAGRGQIGRYSRWTEELWGERSSDQAVSEEPQSAARRIRCCWLLRVIETQEEETGRGNVNGEDAIE